VTWMLWWRGRTGPLPEILPVADDDWACIQQLFQATG
jgi:hypothetical protein